MAARLQYRASVSISDNAVLWSGNHIGHHRVIEDNVFVSSHVVVSGFTEIGANCFLGVNSSVENNVPVAADNWVGPGVVINSSTEPNQLFSAPEPQLAKVGTRRVFKVPG
jgi:carbonic anhydrase/acetyltransferase-like protein (isoleucine patch superfamily)